MAIRLATGDDKFRAACAKAKIPPTRRQWKKWLMRKGLAWITHSQAATP